MSAPGLFHATADVSLTPLLRSQTLPLGATGFDAVGVSAFSSYAGDPRRDDIGRNPLRQPDGISPGSPCP